MTLAELKAGESAVITSVGGKGSLRQHFLDMGMIPDTKVTLLKFAPMGDPMELLIHGYSLTVRIADAKKIEVQRVKSESVVKTEASKKLPALTAHPGYGEEGKYHVKATENPLPKNKTLTFALAGNQNCGKTTLFNALTGANQHVGNFPGVTVDQKSGRIKGEPNTLVTDLPGIYSLSPYTSEEIVSREFILNEKPTGIINIVDATNIERNLYLTLQLMELDVPMVLALNMMDEMRENGGTVLINRMEEMLGIPVVPISASKDEGVDELIRHAMHVAKYQERPGRNDFCDKNGKCGAVHRAVHSIMHLIEDHAEAAGIPLRFAAGKLIEGDILVSDALKLTENEKDMIEHIVLQMESEHGLDRAAAMADMRFSFIKSLCEKTVIKPSESKGHIRSRRLDKIFTGKYTAIPVFVIIMSLVFYLTFGLIGPYLQSLLQSGIDFVTAAADNAMSAAMVNPIIHSLIIDGVFGGVGSILSFVPIIVLLFFFLSMLEDSGYMARVAFVTDKLLRKIGLSGRSIVPMLIGFGCTVPAVMSSRTLPSARDRKMTVMLTPFMSCTAKLPIYVLLSGYLSPEYSGLIIVALYLFGVITGIAVALVAKRTAFKGEAVPFVMELPNYRMPGAKNVLMLLWEKAKDFITRAFTVIFAASIIIFLLTHFDFGLNYVENVNAGNSILKSVATFIAPIFKPLGFDSWQVVTALTTGFIAKESVVSTLGVLNVTREMFTSLSLVALLVFCLLYTPCAASIAAIKRELGGKWALFTVVAQCGIAYIAALLVRTVGILFVM